MSKPNFLSWANVTTLWYESCPGAAEARREVLLQNDLEAMNRLTELAEPLIKEIGQISVQISALEARRTALSKLYKELEKQYNEHSESYDRHLNEK